MAIGTTRYFPLGISTEDRWGVARRRRLLAICAVCALLAAGFAIVGRARLITMKPVDAGLRPATSEAPVEPPGVWYKTEKPDQALSSFAIQDGVSEQRLPLELVRSPENPVLVQ